MENRTKTIVILGCGWLGQIVGEHFVRKGHKVYGTFRREEVSQELNEKDIDGFYLDFNDDIKLESSITTAATHVFAFIPPSAAKNRSYSNLLFELLSQFSPTNRFIFSSSIGIYPKAEGVYDEHFKFDSESTNQLLQAENRLKKLLGNQLTILRLAGLVGPKRHPSYPLSGRELSNDGSNPVNLIHSNDIILAIDSLFYNNDLNGTFNLVNPYHPSKKNYYTKAAKHFGIKPPAFGEEPAINRLVQGNGITERTSFKYHHALDNFDDFLR